MFKQSFDSINRLNYCDFQIFPIANCYFMPATSEPTPGTETRRRLLQAALKEFGQHDYDAVSTRQIVQTADANISAISYHFGGKQGLYLASAAFLADSLYAELREKLGDIEQRMAHADPQQCRIMLAELVGYFVDSLLTGEFAEDAPGFIFREQNQPTDAFAVLYDKLFGPLHRTMVSLVAVARGLPEDCDEARLVAHALLGQAIVFRGARTTMLRHLGRPAYSEQDLQQIRALIAATTAAALDYATVGDQS